MATTPTAESVIFPGKNPFQDVRNASRDVVTLDAATVDSGNNPPTILRRGVVVAKKTADDKYREADSGVVEVAAGAQAQSAEDADGDWPTTTITVTKNGGSEVDVTLSGGANTNALVAGELNGDADFAKDYVADGSGSPLLITTKETGDQCNILVTSTLADAFGPNGAEGQGSFADVGILEEVVDMRDISGAVKDNNATIVRGPCRVVESELVSLTTDAKRALQARGAVFE